MFARIKKSGKYQYLQIVENRKGSPAIRLRFGPHMREMVAGMILLKKDENIRGHVFLSFLALVLRKELESPFERYGYCISLNYFFATVQDQSKDIPLIPYKGFSDPSGSGIQGRDPQGSLSSPCLQTWICG